MQVDKSTNHVCVTVTLPGGTEACAHTLARFEAVYGYLPPEWRKALEAVRP